jgi:hypothetical protein
MPRRGGADSGVAVRPCCSGVGWESPAGHLSGGRALGWQPVPPTGVDKFPSPRGQPVAYPTVKAVGAALHAIDAPKAKDALRHGGASRASPLPQRNAPALVRARYSFLCVETVGRSFHAISLLT